MFWGCNCDLVTLKLKSFLIDLSISLSSDTVFLQALTVLYCMSHTHIFPHPFNSVQCKVVLTTGLSMMPLRKMRSRSLAVVELVLSLSVSRAWCMATHTQEKKEEKEKSLFHFPPLHMLQLPMGNRLKRERVRERESTFTVVHTTWLNERRPEEKWAEGRKEEGEGSGFISFPKQFHLCQSPSS